MESGAATLREIHSQPEVWGRCLNTLDKLDLEPLVPAASVTPIDTIGAGDSFNAGFLAAYLLGEAPDACAVFGNRATALSTLRPGGTESFRDPGFVREFLFPHG
jgi:sugar/nucleoside kinase (ribokinase family)